MIIFRDKYDKELSLRQIDRILLNKNSITIKTGDDWLKVFFEWEDGENTKAQWVNDEIQKYQEREISFCLCTSWKWLSDKDDIGQAGAKR